MRVFLALVFILALTGCREVRVNTIQKGTTAVAGAHQLVIVRDARTMAQFAIKAPVNFTKEFGVLLLMGPHRETGWEQVIESIRPNTDRVRIVAFERQNLAGGEPAPEYRTYTLWIVPNSVYRRGSRVDAVTPSGELITSITLK
jgi:hypothetical protein